MCVCLESANCEACEAAKNGVYLSKCDALSLSK